MKINRISMLALVVACGAGSAGAQTFDSTAIVNAYVNQGAQALQVGGGTIIKPRSGLRPAIEDGAKNYTNYHIFVPAGTATPHDVNPANAPPFSGYFYETPSSLACVYKLVAQASGCNPNTFHTNTNSGSKAIGIVDAYDAPNVRADLTHYASQFGLPAITTANFVIYYCTGTTASTCATGNAHPPYNSGWEGETSLDVQMAHALAPKARIYLVLAKDNSNTALYAAVDKAAALVAAAGGGEISMSWGHHEQSNDVSTSDSHFGVSKVVYFASTGDDRAVGYPATSTKVVSVGGTSISRNATTGAFIQEVSWADAGAGPSAYVARPSYQPSSIGSKRGNPDVAAVANGVTGVWVYVSNQGGWNVFGGTSVASPVMAAIVNSSGHFSTSTAAQQSLMYGTLGTASDWFDVKQGYCGVYASLVPGTGYDFCTGIGAPRGKAGK